MTSASAPFDRERNRERLGLVAILLTLFFAGLVTRVYLHVKTEARVGKRLEQIASTASLVLDRSAHQRLVSRFLSREGLSLPTSADYQEVQQRLRQIKSANDIDCDVSTLIPAPWKPGLLVVIGASNAKPYLGNGFQEDKVTMRALNEGKSHHTAIATDREGSWLAAYAPLKDPAGKIVGLIKVEHRPNEELADANAEWNVWATGLLVLGLLTLAAYQFRRPSVKNAGAPPLALTPPPLRTVPALVDVLRHVVESGALSSEENALEGLPTRNGINVSISELRFSEDLPVWLRICIEDQKRKIDLSRIRTRLSAQNLLDPRYPISDFELLQRLLGASLPWDPSEAAGLGYGAELGKLKRKIEERGGLVELDFSEQTGTLITVLIPRTPETSSLIS